MKKSTDVLISFAKEFNTRDWADSVGIAQKKITVYVKDKTRLPSGLTSSYKGYPVEIKVAGKLK